MEAERISGLPAQILAARERIRANILKTPLMYSPCLSGTSEVYLKLGKWRWILIYYTHTNQMLLGDIHVLESSCLSIFGSVSLSVCLSVYKILVVLCRKVLLQFNPFPHNDTFWRPWETNLLKTLWKKEKLLVTSNFSFSHSVFYPFG